MKNDTTVRGILGLIAAGIVAGLVNTAFFVLVMNNLVGETAQDEVAVSTYSINFFVGWVFFSAWFLAKADEEWKKVAEAVQRKDRELFMLEAPKRIALSIRGKDYEYDGEAATLSNMKNPMKGCGPFVHDDETDRPPAVFGGKATLHFGQARPAHLLLPVIPPK